MTTDGLRLERLRKPGLAVIAAAAGLALSGCYGATINGSKSAFGACGSREYDNQSDDPADDQPLGTSLAPILASARNDVITLQDRTLNLGGSVQLDYNNVALTATPADLTLDLRRALPDRPPYVEVFTTDHVTFDVSNGVAEVSPGAVACSGKNGELYPNGTYAALQLDTQETWAISANHY
jgi:hypothetical protein